MCLGLYACGGTEAEPETVEISITNDNVDEYFEVRELVQWQENDFGEAEVFEYIYKVCLKDEYVDKFFVKSENENHMYNDSQVAFEYQWENKVFHPIIDFDNRTYSFVESDLSDDGFNEISWRANWDGYVEIIDGNWTLEEEGTIFETVLKTEYDDEYTVTRRINIEFIRAEGTLVLMK